MSEIKYWEPIHNAWNKMVDVLFRPFDLGKWMVMGFCAFLANCGRQGGGGGGGSGFNHGNHRSGGGGEEWPELADFVSDIWIEYSHWIILGGCFVVVLIVGLTILVNWLNSRGQFMFLDNVLKNRGAVKEPWSAYRKEANSLMVF
ncbi:MAG: hypothetical protein OEL75_01440, partial [Kiritimatiellaceae bacterium]|nr:hypothetical protein [Kiritimatiellaceae bacterium]